MKIKPSNLYIDPELKWLDSSHREIEPEIGAIGFTSAVVTERGVNEEKRQVTALVSTPNVDRYNEIIAPEAFKKTVTQFLRNPVLIAGHQYSSLNGEPTTIGKWVDLQVTKDGLVGTAQFMNDDPLAESWWQRFRQGVVRAFSIGFISRAWEMRDVEDADGNKQKLRVFTDIELLEISAVAIPANRESLVLAASIARGRTSDTGIQITGELKECDGIHEIIASTLKNEVRKLLNTDPGGSLHTLICDTVEMCACAGGHSDPDDDDVAPDRSSCRDEDVSAVDDVESLLKQL